MNNLFIKEYLNVLKDDLNSTTSFAINGHVFNNVKIVSSSNDIRRGLMWKKNLNDDEAMLFCFDKSSIHNFWMKNTLIPLDVIFLDENKKVISFYSMNVEELKRKHESENDYEKRLKRYSSLKPCKYAIEINQGICKNINLQIGDFIEF